MTSTLSAWRDRLLGRGSAASTVPVLDGALKPNHWLDQAQCVYTGQDPQDLTSDGQRLWLADGTRLLRLDPTSASAPPQLVLTAAAPITALCCVAGGIAIAVGGRGVEVHGGNLDGKRWSEADGRPFNAITGLSADGNDLLLTEGSAVHDGEDWQRDLMTLSRTGRVCRLRAQQQTEVLAQGLGWPFGAVAHNGEVWVSEAWRHQVLVLKPKGGQTPLRRDLPGYPSRLAGASDGGWWLTLFACRTQLVEFVLREPAFRQRMMATIAPQLWAAPQLSSGHSFLEPLQGGAIKQMGVLKPWAPPRSYGLVVRLDAAGRPLYALHSRAGGLHHGIVSAQECDGALWLLSRGAKRLLRLELDLLKQEFGA